MGRGVDFCGATGLIATAALLIFTSVVALIAYADFSFRNSTRDVPG